MASPMMEHASCLFDRYGTVGVQVVKTTANGCSRGRTGNMLRPTGITVAVIILGGFLCEKPRCRTDLPEKYDNVNDSLLWWDKHLHWRLDFGLTGVRMVTQVVQSSWKFGSFGLGIPSLSEYFAPSRGDMWKGVRLTERSESYSQKLGISWTTFAPPKSQEARCERGKAGLEKSLCELYSVYDAIPVLLATRIVRNSRRWIDVPLYQVGERQWKGIQGDSMENDMGVRWERIHKTVIVGRCMGRRVSRRGMDEVMLKLAISTTGKKTVTDGVAVRRHDHLVERQKNVFRKL
ncbi:hypothetical protein L218DRAFT_1021413 [Marasmius fiardii PR-910]|nr:hypothetical protein L218DRAFT_1021413 [Marasmius fiardii PR-910]